MHGGGEGVPERDRGMVTEREWWLQWAREMKKRVVAMKGLNGGASSGRVYRILVWPTGRKRLLMKKGYEWRRRIINGNECVRIS